MARHAKQPQNQVEPQVQPPLQPEPRRQQKKAKRKRKGGLLSTLLILVGVGLLAAAGVMWGQSQWRYYQVDKNNRELAVYATVYDKEQHSTGDEHRAPEVDWAGLKAVNDDVVGWLQVPGTTINYPVYQGETNDTYLHTSATGEYLFGGQLFIDCDCTAPGMVDPVTMIYGHHLLDGSMFEQIGVMDDQKRFDEIDTVWYVTEKGAWECEPLFLFYAHETDQSVRTFRFDDESLAAQAAQEAKEAREAAEETDGEFVNEYPVEVTAPADGLTPEQRFQAYLSKRFDQAVTMRPDAAQIVPKAKHVLCLITCNYLAAYENHGRTVLVCVPKDEAAAATGAAKSDSEG